MSLTALAFLVFFAVCVIGAVFKPLMGIVGYVIHYCLGPEGMWFGAPLKQTGIRFSLVLALATSIGLILHWWKHNRRGSVAFLVEKIALLFLVFVSAYSLIRPPLRSMPNIDPIPLKFTKVLLMGLVITHLCTTVRRVRILVWTFLFGCLFLGYYIFSDVGYLHKGRIEGIGGPDFREANGLGAFLLAFLPLAGVMFITSKWKGKVFAVLAGVFTVNGIVATRSRGAVIAAAVVAVLAVVRAPKKHRLKILSGLIVVAVGGYALTDEGFWERTETIQSQEGERDASAQGRIDTWIATLEMSKDYPMGVGPDNFDQYIGQYNEKYTGRDAHSSYFLALGELGWLGLGLFLLIMVLGGWRLWVLGKVRSEEIYTLGQEQRDAKLLSYGFFLGLVAMAVCGLTISRLYAEMQWWFLLFPAMMQRAVQSLGTDEETEEDVGPLGAVSSA